MVLSDGKKLKSESLYAAEEDAHIAFNEAVEKYIREQ